MPKKKPAQNQCVPRRAPDGAYRNPVHNLVLKQNWESQSHRWWAECSCGYVSQTRVESDGALEAAVIHVKRMRAQRVADRLPNERASIKVAS